ncbi:MAG: HDIG domain-containing protein [Planctomycetes bacterium]|nr:HDIG domain-containing protein [Planctomycetota bacterium]
MSWFDFMRGRGGARRARTGGPVLGPVRGREETGRPSERRTLPGPAGVLFCAMLVGAVVFIIDYGVLPPPLHEKDIAPADFEARESFSYWDHDYIRQLRETAAEQAPLVFEVVPNWRTELLQDLRRMCEIIEGAGGLEPATVAINSPKESQLVERLFQHYTRLGKQSLTRDLLWDIDFQLRTIEVEGVLSQEHYQSYWQQRAARRVLVRQGDDPALLPRESRRLKSVLEAQRELAEKLSNLPRYAEPLQRALARHLEERLKPNLSYDPDASAQQAQAAQEQVPDSNRQVRRGEQILAKGEPVGSDQLRMLREEAQAYKASLPWMTYAFRIMGIASLAAAVIYLALVALRRLEPGIFLRRRQLVLLGLACLAVLAVAKGLMLGELPRQLAPVTFAAVIASLAFSQGVALVITLSLALLTGFTAGGDMSLALTLLLGGFITALPSKRLQKRFDLLWYGLLGGFVQGGTILLLSLLRSTGILTVAGLSQFGLPMFQFPTADEALWGFLNCAGCGLLLSALLPPLEVLFGIITNIRLYELSDPTHPGLRKIQLEAPGTWAHTLQVASLVEPAVEAIGGNIHLARAGTYYHDLGKTLKPEYFVENQMGAEERHRRLAPSVSALIITSHVKDGIELARDYGLPQQIVDFIPEHHGTTLVSFFYHSAQKRAEEDRAQGKGGQVQESFFRYPGPKPRSRETAVLMLADTIEAASRTLEAPSATRLQQFVHELIMAKLLDRQLDDCELTFRDLAVIEATFLRVLVGRFHGRIRYPGQDDQGSGIHPGGKVGGSSSRLHSVEQKTRKIPREALLQAEAEAEGRPLASPTPDEIAPAATAQGSDGEPANPPRGHSN